MKAANLSKVKLTTRDIEKLQMLKFHLIVKRVRKLLFFIYVSVFNLMFNFLDTLMNSDTNISKKVREENIPSPCKKRRRSHKGSMSEEIPYKRGRRPNRSRQNSDSDDTSEHSLQGNMYSSTTASMDSKYGRSPRACRKYNFCTDFRKCFIWNIIQLKFS